MSQWIPFLANLLLVFHGFFLLLLLFINYWNAFTNLNAFLLSSFTYYPCICFTILNSTYLLFNFLKLLYLVFCSLPLQLLEQTIFTTPQNGLQNRYALQNITVLYTHAQDLYCHYCLCLFLNSHILLLFRVLWTSSMDNTHWGREPKK